MYSTMMYSSFVEFLGKGSRADVLVKVYFQLLENPPLHWGDAISFGL